MLRHGILGYGNSTQKGVVMQCVWIREDGTRCQTKARPDFILCLEHRKENMTLLRRGQLENQGIRDYHKGIEDEV